MPKACGDTLHGRGRIEHAFAGQLRSRLIQAEVRQRLRTDDQSGQPRIEMGGVEN